MRVLKDESESHDCEIGESNEEIIDISKRRSEKWLIKPLQLFYYEFEDVNEEETNLSDHYDPEL